MKKLIINICYLLYLLISLPSVVFCQESSTYLSTREMEYIAYKTISAQMFYDNFKEISTNLIDDSLNARYNKEHLLDTNNCKFNIRTYEEFNWFPEKYFVKEIKTEFSKYGMYVFANYIYNFYDSVYIIGINRYGNVYFINNFWVDDKQKLVKNLYKNIDSPEKALEVAYFYTRINNYIPKDTVQIIDNSYLLQNNITKDSANIIDLTKYNIAPPNIKKENGDYLVELFTITQVTKCINRNIITINGNGEVKLEKIIIRKPDFYFHHM